MKRGSEENNHETSPYPSQRLRSTREINIPLDLKVEILKKLPTKSLVRFQCVSKQWSSIIRYRRDFIDSIVTRSLAQPDTYLIFHHQTINLSIPDEFFIFSSTYTQHTEKEPISNPNPDTKFGYVRGLIIHWKGLPSSATIYNPTTRQSLSLPEMKYNHLDKGNCYLGYDPQENQYKVLCITPTMEQSCQVFTLGDNQWRNIQCNVGFHYLVLFPLCINGVIYYRARTKEHVSLLMSFDVRSEKFHHVKAPKTQMGHNWTLINYQGKLGFIHCKKGVEIWVMEKQEWTKIVFYEMEGFEDVHIGGVTHAGEIVIVQSLFITSKAIDVLYYDPRRNSMRCVKVEVEVEGGREYQIRIWAVPGYVENTMRL